MSADDERRARRPAATTRHPSRYSTILPPGGNGTLRVRPIPAGGRARLAWLRALNAAITADAAAVGDQLAGLDQRDSGHVATVDTGLYDDYDSYLDWWLSTVEDAVREGWRA